MSYDYIQAWRDYQPKSRPLTEQELIDVIKQQPQAQQFAKDIAVHKASDRFYANLRHIRLREDEALRHAQDRAAYIEEEAARQLDTLAKQWAPMLVSLTPLLSLEIVNIID